MGFINFQSITIQLCKRNFSVKQFQTIIETIENKKYKSINYCLKLLIEIIDRSIVLSSPIPDQFIHKIIHKYEYTSFLNQFYLS